MICCRCTNAVMPISTNENCVHLAAKGLAYFITRYKLHMFSSINVAFHWQETVLYYIRVDHIIESSPK